MPSPLHALLCAICLPVSLGQREMCLVGLEGQEQAGKGRSRQQGGLGPTGARPSPPAGGCSRQPVLGFLRYKMEAGTELSLIRCSTDAESQLYLS